MASPDRQTDTIANRLRRLLRPVFPGSWWPQKRRKRERISRKQEPVLSSPTSCAIVGFQNKRSPTTRRGDRREEALTWSGQLWHEEHVSSWTSDRMLFEKEEKKKRKKERNCEEHETTDQIKIRIKMTLRTRSIKSKWIESFTNTVPPCPGLLFGIHFFLLVDQQLERTNEWAIKIVKISFFLRFLPSKSQIKYSLESKSCFALNTQPVLPKLDHSVCPVQAGWKEGEGNLEQLSLLDANECKRK